MSRYNVGLSILHSESGRISTIQGIFNPVPGALFQLEQGQAPWGLPQVAHQAGAYPGFCSIKRLRGTLIPPGWDANPSQGYPPTLSSPVLIYTPVMSLARARARTARTGVEHIHMRLTRLPNWVIDTRLITATQHTVLQFKIMYPYNLFSILTGCMKKAKPQE